MSQTNPLVQFQSHVRVSIACVALFLSLPLTSSAFCQWKKVLSMDGQFNSVYFLDLAGPPRIGFVSGQQLIDSRLLPVVFRTEDGGKSWSPTYFATSMYMVVDFAFKDSLTGWFSAMGSGVDTSGLFVTHDQGKTWQYLPPTESTATSVYYDSGSHGLFFGTLAGNTRIGPPFGPYTDGSWDEGQTWVKLFKRINTWDGGFTFFSDSLGFLSNGDVLAIPWWKTTDGGHTWSQIALDSDAWQPYAERGTGMGFALTRNGSFIRTFDAWDTYETVHRFSEPFLQSSDPYATSSCVRGPANDLVIQGISGLYRSTDSGVTWHSLCGVPSGSTTSNTLRKQRFYKRGPEIYVAVTDSGTSHTAIWYLNEDSLFKPPSKYLASWIDVTKSMTTTPGSHVIATFEPSSMLDEAIQSDSVTFYISYDPNTVQPVRLTAGPSIIDSSLMRGHIVVTLSGEGVLPGLQVEFATTLSAEQSVVYLDSVTMGGHRKNCDCSVASLAPKDSISLTFTGCGTSTLSHFMQTGSIFELLSVEPNPAANTLRVGVRGAESGEPDIHLEVVDLLGHERMTQDLHSEAITLDISSLPTGTYFLRLSSGGEVRTRRFVVSR